MKFKTKSITQVRNFLSGVALRKETVTETQWLSEEDHYVILLCGDLVQIFELFGPGKTGPEPEVRSRCLASAKVDRHVSGFVIRGLLNMLKPLPDKGNQPEVSDALNTFFMLLCYGPQDDNEHGFIAHQYEVTKEDILREMRKWRARK